MNDFKSGYVHNVVDEPRRDFIQKIIGEVSCGEAAWAVEECLDGFCTVQLIVRDKGHTYQGEKWTVHRLCTKKQVLDILFQTLAAMFTSKLRDEYFHYKGKPVFKLGGNHKHLLED